MTLLGKKCFYSLITSTRNWSSGIRCSAQGGRAAVLVIGAKKGETYTSKLGYPVQSDLAPATSSRWTLMPCHPGRLCPDIMRRYPEMVDLVRRANEAGKVVAAICHAVWMLASAGIIQGKKVTCFFSIRDDVVHAGVSIVMRRWSWTGTSSPHVFPTTCPLSEGHY